MKLTVWIAQQYTDNRCYNIVARTKKDALAQIAAADPSIRYEPPVKVVVHYRDAFDLFEMATGECGGRSPCY
jgi:hypothetical protein